MRLLIFPRGLTYFPPSDRLGRDIADLIMNPTAARERLSRHIYKTQESHNPLGIAAGGADSVDHGRIPGKAHSRGRRQDRPRRRALDLPGQISQALQLGILSEAEAAVLRDYDAKVSKLARMSMISRRRNWARAPGRLAVFVYALPQL